MPQLKFFWKIFQKIRLMVENNSSGKKVSGKYFIPIFEKKIFQNFCGNLTFNGTFIKL